MALAFNSSTRESEADGSLVQVQVQSQPGLYSKTLPQKKKNNDGFIDVLYSNLSLKLLSLPPSTSIPIPHPTPTLMERIQKSVKRSI